MLGKYIHHCEDSLTAAVFSHLLHLPSSEFWHLLSKSSTSDAFPPYPGESLAVEYWPKWDAAGTGNSNRVVPDLFMRFPGLDLIFEAKRWDAPMQNPQQWQDQFTAYLNEYPEQERAGDVRMIALGGAWDGRDQIIRSALHDTSCTAHICRWDHLLHECRKMARDLAGRSSRSLEECAHHRVLVDIIDLFSWHGFHTGTWFIDAIAGVKPIQDYPAHIGAFRAGQK